MKLFLIAALFLTAFVVVPCLAEEEQEATENVADTPEASEVKNDEEPPPATEGDEEKSEEEEMDEDTNEDIPQELRDEVEQVKRRRRIPQLSLFSCRILKRYGYCRNAGIRRFCVRVCRPPCVDKLSRLSCRRVKIQFKKCNQHIGRFYCRRTCGHCGRPLPRQCRVHKLLTDKTRRKSLQIPPIKCDKALPPGWYRFSSHRGVGQGPVIPNRCVPKNRCGTHAPGWMVGGYPSVRGENVARTVCYHWGKKCCNWKNKIQVTNCGSFLVFFLPKPPVCNLRYCGNY